MMPSCYSCFLCALLHHRVLALYEYVLLFLLLL